MTQEKLDRINELAHLAKERELTADEQEERAALRKEYIEDWRRGTIELLENTYIVTPDGKKHKLPKKGETPSKALSQSMSLGLASAMEEYSRSYTTLLGSWFAPGSR